MPSALNDARIDNGVDGLVWTDTVMPLELSVWISVPSEVLVWLGSGHKTLDTPILAKSDCIVDM